MMHSSPTTANNPTVGERNVKYHLVVAVFTCSRSFVKVKYLYCLKHDLGITSHGRTRSTWLRWPNDLRG